MKDWTQLDPTRPDPLKKWIRSDPIRPEETQYFKVCAALVAVVVCSRPFTWPPAVAWVGAEEEANGMSLCLPGVVSVCRPCPARPQLTILTWHQISDPVQITRLDSLVRLRLRNRTALSCRAVQGNLSVRFGTHPMLLTQYLTVKGLLRIKISPLLRIGLRHRPALSCRAIQGHLSVRLWPPSVTETLYPTVKRLLRM